ncbi:ARM repeat-containing protein [Wilcoxina mikolae CBS 423.85]|nr:ARM repeat-containing protein [Wilcoxina mikolae CBS 423.85]
MTRSEEESLYLSLLSQLQSSEPAVVLNALQTIKHRLIGHDQTKELFVRLGIAESLTSILGTDGYLDKTWLDAKVEAGIVVGSLAYGGESYILHLLQSAALPPLTASLNPDKSPPKLIISSLRTLNTMLDTYISPTVPLNPAVTISSALYTPDGLRNLHEILSQDSTDRLSQDQISLAASLIAKSCRRVPYTTGDEEGAVQREGLHQKLLVGAGVLDALAARLASFAPDEYRKKSSSDSKIPPQAPPNARIAPILNAITAIVRGSKLRSIEFMFSPALVALFPYSASDEKLSEGTAMSLHLPQPKSSSDLARAPRQIITPSAFPPLSATTSSSSSSSQFPPLSATSSHHSMGFPALQHHYSSHSHMHHHPSGLTDEQRILIGGGAGVEDDSESSNGGDTPLRRRADTADLDEDERLRAVTQATDSDNTDPALDIVESELINWLISLVRTGDPITRLTAASLLTNLFLVGLVAKRLVSYIALLVVPVLVRLLDEGGKVIGVGSTGVGGIDAQTWNRWQVEERAPAVLSSLVVENLVFQKAAIDAGAVKKLAAILKKVSESPSAVNGVNGDAAYTPTEESTTKSNPEYNHRMKVKEGVLRCLANLGLFKDDYRRIIIDANILQTVVTQCLKPLTPIQPLLAQDNNSNAEGNPPSVLVAACGVIRAVSRSVSILRTSLIDAAVAIPMFNLLRHENDDVKTAATAAVCNLVLDFSPMRKPISDAGALDVLCDLVKCNNRPLRLNALWAIKHLMLDADATTKRRSLENLGVEYLMSIISTINTDPSTDPEDEEDDDEEMTDDPALETLHLPEVAPLEQRLPPKIRTVVKQLQKRERIAQAAQSRKQAIALQEQGLEFIRNLICGNEVGTMIDLVFNSIGADRLLSLYETLLTTPNQSGEIVNAVVYNIVHIAAGVPRHRQRIIERTDLLKVLLGFWNHRNPHVRSGLAWVVINLTWKEEGNEAEGVQRRINVLRGLGWAERLKEMKKDTELDVKERVKTAEFQLSGVGGNGNGNASSGGGGGGGGSSTGR